MRDLLVEAIPIVAARPILAPARLATLATFPPVAVANQLLVEASFAELSVRGDEQMQQGAAALERHLVRPLVVRMREDGQVLGYRFAGGLDSTSRNLIRTLWTGLHYVVPEGARGEWQTSERDSTGTYACAYEDDGASDGRRSIARRKLGYAKQQGGAQITTDGRSTGVLDGIAGWMRKVEANDVLRCGREGEQLFVSYRSHLSIELLRWKDHPMNARPFVQWDDPNESSPSGAGDHEKNSREIDVSKIDLEEVLKGLSVLSTRPEDLKGREARKIMKTLAALIRARPEALGRLESFVRDEATPTLAAKLVLTSIGSADTPASQAALANAVATGDLSAELRTSAATATLAIRKPTADTLAALLKVAVDPASTERLGSTSLMMLGSCTRRNGSEEASRQLLELEKVLGKERHDVWLAALGNCGLPQVIEPATRHLDSEETHIRQLAVEALRRVDSPKVVPLLIDHLKREDDLDARISATRILAARGDAAGMAYVEQLLTRGSEDERLAAIKGLKRQYRSNPDALRLIQDSAALNDVASVRAAAAKVMR